MVAAGFKFMKWMDDKSFYLLVGILLEKRHEIIKAQ